MITYEKKEALQFVKFGALFQKKVGTALYINIYI